MNVNFRTIVDPRNNKMTLEAFQEDGFVTTRIIFTDSVTVENLAEALKDSAKIAFATTEQARLFQDILETKRISEEPEKSFCFESPSRITIVTRFPNDYRLSSNGGDYEYFRQYIYDQDRGIITARNEWSADFSYSEYGEVNEQTYRVGSDFQFARE